MFRVENISKSLGPFSLDEVSFRCAAGDYFVILGRSGAGKTLLLEIMAGIRSPDAGALILDQRDITSLRIQNRGVGLVFQDQAVFPHMSVAANLAFPLKRKGWGRSYIRRRIHQLAQTTGLEHLLDRFPSTLSGGEVQRAVLARTLASEPRLLLLDEPLNSLDVQYKRELQTLLSHLNQQGQTIIHVTHDYQEASALASKVAVMENGRIQQQGPLPEVFRNPASSFVAEFVGIRNFFRGNVENPPGGDHKIFRIRGSSLFFILPSHVPNSVASITLEAKNILLSRSRPDTSALNNFKGRVQQVIPASLGMEVVVDVGVTLAVLVTRESLSRLNVRKDQQVWVSFKASSINVGSSVGPDPV